MESLTYMLLLQLSYQTLSVDLSSYEGKKILLLKIYNQYDLSLIIIIKMSKQV